MGGDERQARPRRVIPHTATYRAESRPQLRHPFIDTAAQSELNAAPTQSFSGFPDSAHSDRSGQDAQSVQAQANIPIPNVALTISSESSNSRNTSPDLGEKPSPIPILNSGKPPRPPKRSQANTPLEYDDGKAKRVRVHPDVYDIPISPEPNGDLQPTFSTATTAVSSQSGSPNLSAPM